MFDAAQDVNLPTTVLLPGLDGTGDLFAPFVAAAPSRCRVQPLKLPDNEGLGYAELAEWVHANLPEGRVVLLGESFSGPLAILVAAQCVRVVGLVLSTTFLVQPLSGLLSIVPKLLPGCAWSQPPPEFLLRAFLTGGDPVLATALRRAMLGVSGKVVAERIASVLTVNVTAEFQGLGCPVLCLQAGRDRLLSAASVARMRTVKPDAEYATIDGPHLLLQARPQEAWSQLSPFLERVAACPVE
jgi:pimeloyl-[acyl-carrier protein] methyl ester esterase